MTDKGVHKETFHQAEFDGVPAHWVVFFWLEGENPAYYTHSAECFNSAEDAAEFEGELEPYDDWYGSQEITLAVQ